LTITILSTSPKHQRARSDKEVMSYNQIEQDNSLAQVRMATADRPLVLIAEPDEEHRMALSVALEQAGYTVTTIADPSSTPAEACRVLPTLIIVRLANPLAEGHGLCRDLRSDPETRDIPLLVLTRVDDLYTREQIVRAGATAILIEPLRRTLLLRQIRRLLARGARNNPSRRVSWRPDAGNA
jgi:two-component system phosphate regulon response regulator PhoB